MELVLVPMHLLSLNAHDDVFVKVTFRELYVNVGDVCEQNP
jgi:hypothetical protein